MTRDERPPTPGRSVQRGVRAYYWTVSRFIERELRDRPDLPLWKTIAEQHRGGLALDLGCGTGRVTSILADRLGHAVGLDLSVSMLALAQRKTQRGGGRGVRASGGFDLVVGDMRTVAFGRRFDLVTAANDPFAHLPASGDRDRALAAVVAQLAPGGRFVLDAHWFPPDLLDRALGAAGLESEHRADGMIVRERWWCTADGSCRARYEYRRGERLLDSAEFAARYWTVEELRRRFVRAGLQITDLWGDYDRTPWDAATSRHLIAEAALSGGSGEAFRRSM